MEVLPIQTITNPCASNSELLGDSAWLFEKKKKSKKKKKDKKCCKSYKKKEGKMCKDCPKLAKLIGSIRC